MKKQFLIYSLLIVLIFSGSIHPSLAQAKIAARDAEQLVEKTILITDRETYSVEEDILFSAFNISSSELRKANWSNVLYVELIAPDGEVFARRKYSYSEDGATGAVRIPNSVLTGNYYLRAYTRWMRDYSPYHYFYKMVRVINPFRAELLEPTVTDVMNDSKIKSTLPQAGELFLKTDKKIYHKQEQVQLEVSVADGLGDRFAVSVIPKGTDSKLNPNLPALKEVKYFPYYIPETRGLSISGRIVSEADSLPLPFSLVGLTIFKEIPENRNVLTNEQGQFFFDLSQLEGEYEIFISTKFNGKQMPLILVDNDFSTQKIELPFMPVDLSEEAKKMYQSLIINSQIQNLYQQQKVEDEIKSFSTDTTFYGAPDLVLKLKDYIPLPSIKDYIYELIPQVGVRHEGKRTILKVFGGYSDLAIYDPLVMVDMVPIFDIDRVLALQPVEIERIEVIVMPYIRGDIVFGGIVSLFSKKRDLAGIDLPSAGRFITYSMLNPDHVPDATIPPATSRIPDLRNCLYWNPDLKLDANESTKILIDTGDSAGDFVVIIHRIDKTGSTTEARTEFTIKE